MTDGVGIHVVGSVYPSGGMQSNTEMPRLLPSCKLYSDTFLISDSLVHQFKAIAVGETRIACYHCIASVPTSYSSCADRVVITYLRLRSWPSGFSRPLSRW